MAEEDNREWLDREEAARFLGVRAFKLWLLEAEGEVKAGRTPGGTRRLSRRSLQEYLIREELGK